MLFGQMAAQGQSLFTSSGDSGAFGCLLTDDSYTGRRTGNANQLLYSLFNSRGSGRAASGGPLRQGRQQRAAAAGTIRVRCTLV